MTRDPAHAAPTADLGHRGALSLIWSNGGSIHFPLRASDDKAADLGRPSSENFEQFAADAPASVAAAGPQI